MAGWLNAQLVGRMTWRSFAALPGIQTLELGVVRISTYNQSPPSVVSVADLDKLRMARSRVGWLCRGTTSLFPRMYASFTNIFPRRPCTYKRIEVQGMSRPRRGHLPGLEQARVRADSQKVLVCVTTCRWKNIRRPQKFVASSSRQCARVSLIGLSGHSESMDPPELIKDAVLGH
ncbi:hypothetical protein B0H11DRAFT_2059861 [Mycena galericulata]|nr:hypothetical protein B0H11DRAFT_2059861 [Mycena galericulata]